MRAALLLLLVGCGRVDFDARADGALISDTDGDGVADPDDNCPGVANPDQANEDGDRFGDACDPCPPFADADPIVDADGDGVPDACDPFPTVAGETIALFEGFTAPTTGLVVGSWTFAGGQAFAASSVDQLDDLVWPSPGGSAETVMTHLTIDAELGAGHLRGTGIIHELGTPATNGSTSTDGVTCVLGLDTGEREELVIITNPDIGEVAADLRPAAPGVTSGLSSTRTGTAYACTADPALPAVTGTASFPRANPKLGLHTRSSAAHFDWVMIVRTP